MIVPDYRYICIAFNYLSKFFVMSVSFKLRSDKKDKPVTIYARFRESGKDWGFATPYEIKSSNWNTKRGLPQKGKTPEEQKSLESIAQGLAEIEKALLLYVDKCKKKGKDFTKEDVEGVIIATASKKNDTNREIPSAISSYLDFLISAMEKGSFKFGANNYDADTIKVWKVFRNVYANFEKSFEDKTGRVLDWEGINKSVYDSFVNFCQEWGYMTKSINKYLICFKALIRYAAEYHSLHNNTVCLKHFSKVREIEGCTQTKVYLTDSEIQALYEMPLEKGSLKDQVRDIFLIGCYTGQRVSDYGHFTADNFTTTPRGTKVVRLIQEKTDNSVIVPILNDNLLRIAEKYNYQFPTISDVIINRYIKNICAELSVTVESLAKKVKTTLTLREVRAEKSKIEKDGKQIFERDDAGNVVKPRFDLVCTHTARRSMITNLYKSRLFSTLQMMSISGHKSEATFFGYISESAEELAEEIADIQRRYADMKKASNEDLF